jgi:hypothetical protein
MVLSPQVSFTLFHTAEQKAAQSERITQWWAARREAK